ncbi:YSIRK-type signal peptide-containing protein [Atopobacter sp. AH10]|uniref:mucin-binding protein n=1 Tax=Atopobacter sp. AH10 TaxID=2315861 RepID=UPI000EF256A4|nr:MucBP domain-containing protein [Atopobacter sp. AH10]RLK64121.1 YSIRK-type signal peptide-containing protein [Atopobacter sp. AH10]
MVGKNNSDVRQRTSGKQIHTYAIRKLKCGAASVMIATGIFFANGQGVIRAEENTTDISELVPNEDKSDALDKGETRAVAEGNTARTGLEDVAASHEENANRADSSSQPNHLVNGERSETPVNDRASYYANEGLAIQTVSPKVKEEIDKVVKDGVTILPVGRNTSSDNGKPNGYDPSIPYHDGKDGWYSFVQLRGARDLSYMARAKFFDGNIVFSVKSTPDGKGGYTTDGTGIIEVYKANETSPFKVIHFDNQEGQGEFIYEPKRGWFSSDKKNLLSWNKDSVSLGDQPYRANKTQNQMANFHIAYNYPEVSVKKDNGPYYADGWFKPHNHKVRVLYKDIETGETLSSSTVNGLTGMKYETKQPSDLPGGYKYVKSTEKTDGYLSPFNKVGDSLTKRTQPYLDIKYTLLDMNGRMKWELFYAGDKKAEGVLDDNKKVNWYTGTAQNGRQYTQYIENPFLVKANDIIHYYKRDKEKSSVQVIYFDKTENKTLETTPLMEGQPNALVNYTTKEKIAEFVAKGYKLYSDAYPQQAKFGPNGSTSVYKVTLEHDTEIVEEHQPVKRTIHYRYENANGSQAAEDKVDTVTFDRWYQVDKVNKSIVFDNGFKPRRNDTTFDAVKSPVIEGYTADRPVVDEVTAITKESKDIEEVVIYKKNAPKVLEKAKVKVEYFDETDKKVIEISPVLEGPVNSTVAYSTKETLDKLIAKGYEFVKSDYPNDPKFLKANSETTYRVILKHGKERKTETKQVTRVIHYRKDNPKGEVMAPDHHQEVMLERTIELDKVTKLTKVSDYKAKGKDNFEKVPSPVLTHYTPDRSSVEAMKVSENTPNQEEWVIYTGDARVLVDYKDQDESNKILESKSDLPSGKEGEKVNYSTAETIQKYEDKGYEKVSDNFPQDASYGKAGSIDHYEVLLKHKKETLNPQHPGKPGEKINPKDKDPKSPNYPQGTDKASLEKVVKQIIHYVYEDGRKAKEDVTDLVRFEREVLIDKVTGKILEDRGFKPVHNDTSFDAVKSPEIKGYSPDKLEIAEVTGLNEKSSDREITVTYKKKESPAPTVTQKAIIKYIDDSKTNRFDPDTVTGESNQPIDYSTLDRIASLKKLGYKLVSDNFTKDGGQKFDQDEKVDQVFEVHVTPRIEPVTPDKKLPKPGDKVTPEDPNTPVWPNSVTTIDNHKTVRRTIRYWKEKINGEKAFEDVVQTVEFSRVAYVNLLTGEITYGEWTSKNPSYDEVKSPYLMNYHEDRTSVPKETVKVSAKDSVEDVIYKPVETDRQPEVEKAYRLTVKYLDDKGKELRPTESSEEKYKAGDTYKTSAKVIEGYILTKDPENAQGKFNDSSIEVVYVYKELVHEETIAPTVKQKAIIKYIDDSNTNRFDPDTVTGESNQPIDYSTADRIASLKKRGYKLVSDNFTKDGGQKFDQDEKVDQVFEVHVTPRIEPVTPDKKLPKPGDKVTKEDPNTPVWPKSVTTIDNHKTVTRTIRYVYEDGRKADEDRLQRVSFTRLAYVNLVTGAIEYAQWESKQDRLASVISPVKEGYTVDIPVVSEQVVEVGDEDSLVLVTYKPKEASKATEEAKEEHGKEKSKDNKEAKSSEKTAKRVTEERLPQTGSNDLAGLAALTAISLGLSLKQLSKRKDD